MHLVFARTFLTKYLPILIATCFAFTAADAQHSEQKRVLRQWTETGDTTTYKIKKNKAGEITFLDQAYLEYEGEVVFEIREVYHKGKEWGLWRYREVLKKKKRKSSVYKTIPDGKQYGFNENGQLDFELEYKMGELLELEYYYHYYPDGNLMLVAEFKKDELWNIIEYKYPNGEDYDFGNFKNGEGTIVYLTEDGKPCLECTTLEKKTKGKLLCEEE